MKNISKLMAALGGATLVTGLAVPAASANVDRTDQAARGALSAWHAVAAAGLQCAVPAPVRCRTRGGRRTSGVRWHSESGGWRVRHSGADVSRLRRARGSPRSPWRVGKPPCGRGPCMLTTECFKFRISPSEKIYCLENGNRCFKILLAEDEHAIDHGFP